MHRAPAEAAQFQKVHRDPGRGQQAKEFSLDWEWAIKKCPAFRQGKHRVWLYAGHSSGRKPRPTFAARGPKGREKKCAFTPCWDYDAVDKENGRLTEGGRKSPCLAL